MLHLVFKSQATDAFVRSFCVDTAASALAARLQLAFVFVWVTESSGKNMGTEMRISDVQSSFRPEGVGPVTLASLLIIKAIYCSKYIYK